MSNNPDFQTPGSIKIAFPLRVDGAVLCGRQIGQQFAGLRVPAEEDLGGGRGVEGGIVNAAEMLQDANEEVCAERKTATELATHAKK